MESSFCWFCRWRCTWSINWKNTSGYTCEFWLYVPSTANTTYLATSGQTDIGAGPGQWLGGANYWSFGLSPTFQVQFYFWSGSKNSIGTAANAVTTNSWNAIAVSVATSGTSSTIRLFVNGVLQNIRKNNTGTYATSYVDTAGVFGTTEPLQIGRFGGGSPMYYMDELRISNSTRYTANYTPATSEFTSNANTQLLLHFAGANNATTFTDSSSFNRTITNPDPVTVKVSTAQGKF